MGIMAGKFTNRIPVSGVHRFLVTVGTPGSTGERTLGRFSSIKGLGIEIELYEVREENQRTTSKRPSTATFGPIVFEQAVDLDEKYLYNWMRQVLAKYCEDPSDLFKDIYIWIYDNNLNRVLRVLLLEKAWPYIYKFGDLDGLKSDLWKETVSFTCSDILDVTPE